MDTLEYINARIKSGTSNDIIKNIDWSKVSSKNPMPFLKNIITDESYFDKNGNLKQFIVDYMNFAINRMLKKEMITQEEYDNFVPVIELKGIAKKLIEHTDSVPDFQLEM